MIITIVMILNPYLTYNIIWEKHFEMKDLRSLSYFFGLEVSSYSVDITYLKQNTPLISLLDLVIMDSATLPTPLDSNVHPNFFWWCSSWRSHLVSSNLLVVISILVQLAHVLPMQFILLVSNSSHYTYYYCALYYMLC